MTPPGPWALHQPTRQPRHISTTDTPTLHAYPRPGAGLRPCATHQPVGGSPVATGSGRAGNSRRFGSECRGPPDCSLFGGLRAVFGRRLAAVWGDLRPNGWQRSLAPNGQAQDVGVGGLWRAGLGRADRHDLGRRRFFAHAPRPPPGRDSYVPPSPRCGFLGFWTLAIANLLACRLRGRFGPLRGRPWRAVGCGIRSLVVFWIAVFCVLLGFLWAHAERNSFVHFVQDVWYLQKHGLVWKH